MRVAIDPNPRAVLAADADVAPVPPFVIGTVFDNVEPAAVIVMSPVPLKATPLIFLEAASAVAVAAFPLISPVMVDENV